MFFSGEKKNKKIFQFFIFLFAWIHKNLHNDLSRVDIQPIWSYKRYKRHVSSKRDRSSKQLTGRSNLFVHEHSKILHYYLLIQSILDAYLSLVLRATLGITTLLSREAHSGSRLARSYFLCTVKCWTKRRWSS